MSHKKKFLIGISFTQIPLNNIKSETSRNLQSNKKYTVVKNTVLIPCTKRKLPVTVQAHFYTTTSSPVLRLIQQQSHILQKLFKILNLSNSYTIAREAYRVSKIKWAAIDSGASKIIIPPAMWERTTTH